MDDKVINLEKCPICGELRSIGLVAKANEYMPDVEMSDSPVGDKSICLKCGT